MASFLRAALCAATALACAPPAYAADFVTYTIRTSGTGQSTFPSGTTSILTDLTFFYVIPISAVAAGSYSDIFTEDTGYFSAASTSLRYNSGTITFGAASLPGQSPSATAVGSVTGAICIPGTSLPTGATATCGGTVQLNTNFRVLAQSYTGLVTALEVATGTGAAPAPFGLVTAIPEPSTWALMLAGFGMAGYALRRRRAAVLV